MEELKKLKDMIDEEYYPYFTDEYLTDRIAEGNPIEELAKELIVRKAGIEELKLGDITIPSPRSHFMQLLKLGRKN